MGKRKILAMLLMVTLILNNSSLSILAADCALEQESVEVDVTEETENDTDDAECDIFIAEEEDDDDFTDSAFSDDNSSEIAIEEDESLEDSSAEDSFTSDETGENIIASGTCGDDLTWNLDEVGTLTIAGSGKMTEWESTSSVPWKDYRSSIKKVIVQSGVTDIGAMAFYACAATEVAISDSVTVIGDLAFSECNKLIQIMIPSSVISIAVRAFDGCSSLESINVSAGNEKYCSVDGILFSADKTVLHQYPDNYQKNEYIIPDTVNAIGQGAFSDCTTLEHLTIPASVVSFSYGVFSGCRNLIKAGPVDSSSECNIEYAWKDIIPAKAFYSSSIKTIIVGTSIEKIESEAFKWCSDLKDVYYDFDEEAWNKIVIDSNNDSLLSATLHLGDGAIVDPPESEGGMPEPQPLGVPIEVTEAGDGTEEHPYRIASAEDLASIQQDADAHYILADDFVISDESDITFEGVFDGNHHTITLRDKGGFGLFYVNKGTIKNLNIVISAELLQVGQGHYDDEINIGSICAENYGVIQDCTATGLLNIDYLYTGGRLELGGITGFHHGDEKSKITRCWSALDIKVDGPDSITDINGNPLGKTGAHAGRILIGGIAGYCEGNIEKCLNTGNISANFFEDLTLTGEVHYAFICGGIVGWKGKTNATIAACVQAGKIIKMNSWLIGHRIIVPEEKYYFFTDSSGYAIQTGFIAGGEYVVGSYDSFLDKDTVKGCSIWKECYLKRELKLQGYEVSDTFTCNAEESEYKTYSSKVIINWWKGLKREEKKDVDENTSFEEVAYFKEWDADNQIAYFGKEDLLGSKVVEETDTAFIDNVDELVGKYVLAEIKSRNDDFIGPDTLISIKPVESKTGTVTATDSETITLDGTVYKQSKKLLYPERYVGQFVLYHIYENAVKEVETLERKTGTLSYWNSKTREVRIEQKYYLSSLTNTETLKILGETGKKDDFVEFYVDKNDFIYLIRLKDKNEVEKHIIDIKKDTWNFKNFPGCGKKYWKFWYPKLQAIKLCKRMIDSLDGVCYGMVMTAINLNSNEQNPDDFSVNSVAEIDKESKSKSLGMTAEEYIRYMFPIQCMVESYIEDDLNSLYNAVRDYQDGKNDGAEISICGQYFNSSHAWHALWGIRTIEEENQSKIVVYDCNHPGQERYIILKKDKDGNFVSWSYDLGLTGASIFGTGQPGKPKIKYICFEGATFYTLLTQKLKGIEPYSDNDSSANLVTITNGSSEDETLVELDTYGVIEKTEDQEVPTEDLTQYYWTRKNYINIDGAKDGIEASLIGISSSIEVVSKYGKDMALSLEEKKQLKLKTNMEDTVNISLKDLGNNEETYIQEIEGKSGLENIMLYSDINQINITGFSSISINYKKDNEELTEDNGNVEIKSMDPEHNYSIVKDDNKEEVVVKEDTDGDGIYEKTVLTQSIHKHLYRYNDNGDGTHTKKCVKGDDSSVENHTYFNGKCLCGAKEDTSIILSGTCGDELNWTLNSDGIFCITGTGNMKIWKKFSDTPWYEKKNDIRKLIINKGVTSVSPYAFSECKNIEEISLAESLTAIGEMAFDQCERLKSVTLPECLRYIGTGAFANCLKLTEVTVPASVRYLGAYRELCTFDYCETMYGYTNSAAYWYAQKWGIPFKSLGTLTQEDSRYIGGEFTATGKKGENIYWALYGDGQLFFCGTGQMDETDTGNGGSAELLFDYRDDVKKVIFTEGVESVGAYALAGSEYRKFEKLNSVRLENSVKKIDARAFFRCPALQKIIMGTGVSVIGEYAFSYDTVLSQIVVDDSNPYLKSLNNVLLSKDETILYRYPHTTDTGYTIPMATKIIAMDAFGDCAALTSITFSNSVEKIMKDAFDGCSNLQDIYYVGFESEWKKIEIESGNSCLSQARMHYTKICSEHKWSNWETILQATVFNAEQQKRECTVCNKSEICSVGEKLTPTLKVNITSVILQPKQTTTEVRVSELANGDSIVSWKSSDSSVVKVDSKTGKITAQDKIGNATVIITLASGKTAEVKVSVQKATVKTTAISGLKSQITLKKGKSTTLKPRILPANSTEKVIYKTANSKIAAVNSKGVITAKLPGTTKITIQSGTKKVVIKVVVTRIATTKITNIKGKLTLKKGKSYILKPKLVPENSDDKVSYSSSNKKIVEVSNKGKITAKKKGTAIITIRSGKKKVICKVTVR